MPSSRSDEDETTLIVNPKSGSGDHMAEIRDRASLLGYEIRESEREKHAIELTRQAIESGATEVVAVGGDGTLNEVIRGAIDAGVLGAVTIGVIPTGTGNDFAKNIGITSIDEGFRALQHGERRRLDVGMANGHPFANSCVAGLTAEASARTSSELKSRLGVFAYVVTTLRVVSQFQGLELTARVENESGSDPVWSGSATIVLIGNGRRFSMTGGEQANIEDGLLDVTIIEDATAIDLVGDQPLDRLFGDAENYITRMLVSSVNLSVETGETATFSLDGEMREFTSVSLEIEPGAMRMPVGDEYEPIPERE